ncbi:MAG: SGNH/GDSL hydrolase family protein [Flavobacteriales bacterium]|nr:SGNH/GDSL hydrolase family protein [Flavobacteriales bacterium]
MCITAPVVQAQKSKDFAGLARFAEKNAALAPVAKGEKRVVFLGNSITEGWMKHHKTFFEENKNYVNRGISGQTSEQFLLRFRSDVINLRPYKVIINVGTNDIAENTRPYNEDYTCGNIGSMVELARANTIKVVLSSVLPAAGFSWRKDMKDAPVKIEALNARIKAYAQKEKLPYIDYYTPMVYGDKRELNPAYTYYGVHPTAAGYEVMEKLVQEVLK